MISSERRRCGTSQLCPNFGIRVEIEGQGLISDHSNLGIRAKLPDQGLDGGRSLFSRFGSHITRGHINPVDNKPYQDDLSLGCRIKKAKQFYGQQR